MLNNLTKIPVNQFLLWSVVCGLWTPLSVQPVHAATEQSDASPTLADDLATIQKDMDRVQKNFEKIAQQHYDLFSKQVGQPSQPLFNPLSDAWGGFVPAVDIQETPATMVVTIDLPGLDKDKLQVTLKDQRFLEVRGERKSNRKESAQTAQGAVVRQERSEGAFSRRIELPAAASESGMKAQYENGVLTVALPKAPQKLKEKQIPVNVI